MKKSRRFGKSVTSSKAVALAIGLVALALLLIPYIFQYENVIKLMGASLHLKPPSRVWQIADDFRLCNVPDPRSPNGEPMISIKYQCSGDAYIQFGRKLAEFSSMLPAPIGRRPFPLQDNTAVFAIGNSHIRQIFEELVCQYSGKIETFHDEFTGGFGEHFSVKFRNNATLVVMTNSLFVYSPNWLEHLESVTKRKLSSFDAIVLGKFNGYKESRGTIFAAAIQNISAGYSDVNFQITPAPKLNNLAAVYRGPLIYVGMFAKYGQQQKDESIITMKEERRKNNRANIYVIDARKNIKALGECGSDDKYTMGRCHESGDVNANRESENMHRCVGEFGGHPDLIAWEVVEQLHQIIS